MRKRRKHRVMYHYLNDNTTLVMTLAEILLDYIHKTNKYGEMKD